MAEVPLGWKLQIQGAEEVRFKLAKINDEFKRGEITAGDYAKGLRQVNRDARSFTQSMNTQKNLFLAMHPNVNRLSKAMNAFGRVSRQAVNLITALNVASLVNQGVSASMAAALNEIEKKQRAYNDAVKIFGADSIQAADALGDLNAATARLNEQIAQQNQQNLSNFGLMLGVLGTAAASSGNLIVKLIPAIKGLSAASLIAVAPFAAIAVAVTSIVSAGIFLIAIFERLSGKEGPFTEFVEQFAEILGPNFTRPLHIFFGSVLPKALKKAAAELSQFFLVDLPKWASTSFDFMIAGFSEMWNTVLGITENVINGMLSGIEGFVNGAIDLLNSLIKQLNNIPGVSIPLIAKFAISPLDLSGASVKNSSHQQSAAGSASVGAQQTSQFQQTVVGSALSKQTANDNLTDISKELERMNSILSINPSGNSIISSQQAFARQKSLELQKQGSQILGVSGIPTTGLDERISSIQNDIQKITDNPAIRKAFVTREGFKVRGRVGETKLSDGQSRQVRALRDQLGQLQQQQELVNLFSGSGSASSPIININVEGSVIAEDDLLSKIDDSLKDSMKRIGFT